MEMLKLKRARGEARRRLIKDRGFDSEAQLRAALVGSPGSRAYIETLARYQSRAVRDAEVIDTEPGRFIVQIRLAWWSWLACGFLHRRIRRGMEATKSTWSALGTVPEVVVR